MYKGLIAFLIVGAASVASSLPLTAQTAQTAQTPNTPTTNSALKSAVPTSDVYFINRAKNLARQAAINANGGLAKYRPDPVMYGPAIQTAYARHNDGSITFRFTGSVPGASSPSFETVARVSASGVVKLEYNGALRTVGTEPLPSTPSNVPVSITVPDSASSSAPSVPSNVSLPTPGIIPPSSVTEVPVGTSPAIAGANQDAFVSRAQNLARQAVIKANGGLKAYRPEASMYGPSARSPFVKNADGSLVFNFKGGTPGASAMTIESVVVVTPAGSVNIQYNGPVRQ
jgi:hypothetical protein